MGLSKTLEDITEANVPVVGLYRLISKTYIQLIKLHIKNKQPYSKMGRRPQQTFSQRRHMDDQQAHDKTFNITVIREM